MAFIRKKAKLVVAKRAHIYVNELLEVGHS